MRRPAACVGDTHRETTKPKQTRQRRNAIGVFLRAPAPPLFLRLLAPESMQSRSLNTKHMFPFCATIAHTPHVERRDDVMFVVDHERLQHRRRNGRNGKQGCARKQPRDIPAKEPQEHVPSPCKWGRPLPQRIKLPLATSRTSRGQWPRQRCSPRARWRDRRASSPQARAPR